MRAWIRRGAVFLALLLVLVFGNQLWNVSHQVASLWDYVLKPPTIQANPEVTALRAQLEVMRQYDQRLLQTVYWALAVIVVIAVALVGFGWFTNFRIYDRDKALLQEDLHRALKAATDEASKTLAAQARNAAEQAAVRVASEVNRKFDSLNSDMKGLLYERAMAKALRWEKSVPTNALTSYIRAAGLVQDRPLINALELTDAVDGIVRLLEAGVPADTYALSLLKPMLDSLPAEHADVAKKIRRLAGIPT